MEIQLEDNLSKEDDDFLRARLDEYNARFVGPSESDQFSFTLRNDAGEIIAGVTASCIWQWVHIHVLWVSDSLRGQGMGSQLLKAAEVEAVKRGRKFAVLHTFSFQARPFYERHGYLLSGELKDFPEGHSQFKMYKQLSAHG
ncbi:MAG: GNAT family N-acetyltransferase [Pseudomonadales bacterium]|nr:GNAT family N-acetyltransferase [Pseudomonadales bacterium]